jgi:hypothetical protein
LVGNWKMKTGVQMTHKSFPFVVFRLDGRYSPYCFHSSIWQRLFSNIYFVPTTHRRREERQMFKAALEKCDLEVLGLVQTRSVAFWVVIDRAGIIPQESILNWPRARKRTS